VNHKLRLVSVRAATKVCPEGHSETGRIGRCSFFGAAIEAACDVPVGLRSAALRDPLSRMYTRAIVVTDNAITKLIALVSVADATSYSPCRVTVRFSRHINPRLFLTTT
jgi:hypothetical protein